VKTETGPQTLRNVQPGLMQVISSSELAVECHLISKVVNRHSLHATITLQWRMGRNHCTYERSVFCNDRYVPFRSKNVCRMTYLSAAKYFLKHWVT